MFETLRRKAKKIARETGRPYTEILDRFARERGFPNWARMMAASRPVRSTVIAGILRRAIDAGGTHIHITSNRPFRPVTFRVDGFNQLDPEATVDDLEEVYRELRLEAAPPFASGYIRYGSSVFEYQTALLLAQSGPRDSKNWQVVIHLVPPPIPGDFYMPEVKVA